MGFCHNRDLRLFVYAYIFIDSGYFSLGEEVSSKACDSLRLKEVIGVAMARSGHAWDGKEVSDAGQ